MKTNRLSRAEEQFKPPSFRMFAWYRLIYFPFAAVGFISLFYLYPFGTLSMVLLFLMAVWHAWISPHLNGPYIWKHDSPKKSYQRLRWSVVWMVPFSFLVGLIPLSTVFRLNANSNWLWMPFMGMATLALLGMLTVPMQCRWLRRRFVDAADRWGLCYECGYDLRFSDDCPECGYHFQSTAD